MNTMMEPWTLEKQGTLMLVGLDGTNCDLTMDGSDAKEKGGT